MSFLDLLFGKHRSIEKPATEPYTSNIPDPDDDEELKKQQEDAQRRLSRLRRLNEEYDYEQFERGHHKRH